MLQLIKQEPSEMSEKNEISEMNEVSEEAEEAFKSSLRRYLKLEDQCHSIKQGRPRLFGKNLLNEASNNSSSASNSLFTTPIAANCSFKPKDTDFTESTENTQSSESTMSAFTESPSDSIEFASEESTISASKMIDQACQVNMDFEAIELPLIEPEFVPDSSQEADIEQEPPLDDLLSFFELPPEAEASQDFIVFGSKWFGPELNIDLETEESPEDRQQNILKVLRSREIWSNASPSNYRDRAEKILGHKFGGKNRLNFRIKWSGYDLITNEKLDVVLQHRKVLLQYLDGLKDVSKNCLKRYAEIDQLLKTRQ